MTASPVWLFAEERYLHQLRETCDVLRQEYLTIYSTKQRQLYKLKLPAIILSSVGGFVSFGSANFETNQRNINIVVGSTGLFVAILNTIESFFNLSNTMVSAKTTALSLQLLSQKITVELSLDVQDRCMNGINYLRECFNEYESIMKEAVPIVHSKATSDTIAKMNKSLSSSEISSNPSPATRPMIIKIKD